MIHSILLVYELLWLLQLFDKKGRSGGSRWITIFYIWLESNSPLIIARLQSRYDVILNQIPLLKYDFLNIQGGYGIFV